MSDIFISYARSTADQAQAVAEALRAQGYGVWRDDELPAHRAYAEVIEERLRSAQAVVVVWSAAAVKSQWVRAEADVARQAGTWCSFRSMALRPPCRSIRSNSRTCEAGRASPITQDGKRYRPASASLLRGR
jgi:adenylate cyclase